MVGRAIVALLFPERIGKGIKDDALWILIPIWSIGIMGVVLLILGIIPTGKTGNTESKPVVPPANRLRRREKAGTEEEPLDLD